MRTTLFLLALLLPSDAGAEECWPQFRGPRGDGSTAAENLPLRWSETQNVRWKTPVHGRGWSSPVVWGDRVWMTTATEDGREMYAVAVDLETGRVLHDVRLFHNDALQETHALNSFASPSPAVEQGRVYVHFGVYGTACLDAASGKALWQRRDILCDHFRGPGSSPILFGELLVFPMDGIDVQYLIALDKRTGKTVWKTDRSTDFGQLVGDMRKAYSTPQVVEAAGRLQMICTGAQATQSYDPRTGEELWKVRHKGFSNVARPLLAHGLVMINSGFTRATLLAVRPDGHGDVTDSHVVWTLDKGVPQKPSPVLAGDLLFMVGDAGIASCVEATTGKLLWQERVEGQYSASPITDGRRVYFCNHDDSTTVVAAEREFRVLAVNRLDDGCMASPAVAGDALLLRTRTHLYRIEP